MSEISILKDNSDIESCLLTPPSISTDARDVPFKPKPSDQISLNQRKKRHRQSRSAVRYNNTSRNKIRSAAGELPVRTGGAKYSRTRSKSLSYCHTKLKGTLSNMAVQADAVHVHTRRQLRRWTLPSKAPSTRSMTPLKSTIIQTTVTNSLESPAMITLRRATTTKKRSQAIQYTSFPEPQFSFERENLLSYLISTFSASTPIQTTNTLAQINGGPETVLVGRNASLQAVIHPATPVCTETMIETSTISGKVSLCGSVARRTSTKYVTSSGSYEIVWDENDHLPITQESSCSFTGPRRESAAAMALEAQLARTSVSIAKSPAGTSPLRMPKSIHQSESFSMPYLPNNIFEQAVPKALRIIALRDLPRSRSGYKPRKKLQTGRQEQDFSPSLSETSYNWHFPSLSVDFCPPLGMEQNRGTYRMNSQEISNSDYLTFATEPPSPRQKAIRSGSMLGASAHIRRNNSMITDRKARLSSMMQRSHGGNGHIPSDYDMSPRQHSESDTWPLLLHC